MRRDPEAPEEQEGLAESPARPEEEVAQDSRDYPTEAVKEVPAEPAGPVWVSEPEEARGIAAVDAGAAVLESVDQEIVGLTVSDGFRFGCGFVLALAIGMLAFLVVMTALVAVGALIGFKPPF